MTPELYTDTAQYHLAAGDWKGALPWLRKANQANPRDLQVLVDLRGTYFELGNTSQEKKVLERLLHEAYGVINKVFLRKASRRLELITEGATVRVWRMFVTCATGCASPCACVSAPGAGRRCRRRCR